MPGPRKIWDSPLEDLLAHMKHALDVLAVALVAQRTATVVLLEIGQERIGEVLRLPLARRLERTVEFAILSYAADESPQTVARVDIAR